MDSNLLIAVLSLIGTIFGTLVGAVSMNKIFNYKLTLLESKIEKFENVVERIVLIECKLNEIDNYIKDNYGQFYVA